MKKLSEIQSELIELALPVGCMIVEASPKLPILCINETFAQMLGFSNEDELFGIYGGSAWSFVSPLDRERLEGYAATRIGTTEGYEISYRAVKRDGSMIWVNQNSRHTLDETGREVIFAYYTDISAQKQIEMALRESESRYAAAVRSANINIWEYDYSTDSMTIFSKSPKVNPKGSIVPNYMKTVLAEGHISEESAPLLFDMIERLKHGAGEVEADLWIRQNPEDEFWCERVIYTNSFDEKGNPSKVYCVGRDITKEKEAEKRYHDELSYREAMQKATMASINVNLTKNKILDYKSIFPEVTARMAAAETVQAYFDHLYTELSEMREACAAVFNRDGLLHQFANGKTTLSLELARTIGGRRYWTIMTAHMMKKENNDVVAFLYSTDITNERTMQNIMNAIVKTDYDFLVVVDAVRNSAVRYSEQGADHAYAVESEDFEGETRQYLRDYICPEDVPRTVEEITVKNILEQLERQSTYSVFYGVPDAGGGVRRKQLRFRYINRERKSILMTRVDITAAVEEQEKRNRELVAAVEMAEHANAAKSEFLSRISHEIRTPMNAIMGMDQLAAQRVNDPIFVMECIEKSQYASRYLLQLLNDILDMSKIESGKVELKIGRINCRIFLNAVDTIIRTQAVEKGVHYVVTQFKGCQKSYMGDSVRLQQILINILSNAVKFTAQGGTVHLDIAQMDGDETQANICFTISDTGIGIGARFLPDIFKPFSQEHNGIRSGYGGSGLGLAISKNLAGLMGGDILVESVLGEGTTFRVQIPFGIPTQGEEEQDSAEVQSKEYDFTGRKILLVEDHPLNIMVARKLLEFKHARVEVAENGEIGLRMFAEALEQSYDAVLMDIRMPVMDGLQCAEGIRMLDSRWAKRVPIIAMSANAFEEDVAKSKKAGMNAHLAKPIEGERLYETLYDLMLGDPKSDDVPQEATNVAVHRETDIMNSEAYMALEHRFTTVLRQNHIDTWMYDLPRHTIIQTHNTEDIYGVQGTEISNVPECLIAGAQCYVDDQECFRDFYNRLYQGETEVSVTVRLWDVPTQGYIWKRCSYTVLPNGNEKPIYALGSAVDVSDEMETKQKYEDAIEYRYRTLSENVILAGHCNVTRNIILEVEDRTGLGIKQGLSTVREDFFRGIASLIPNEKEREVFGRTFGNENMKNSFELGITRHEYDCTIKLGAEEGIRWISTHIDTALEPKSNELIGFLTITDVSSRKMQEQVLDAVIQFDYDFVAHLNLQSNIAVFYNSKDKMENQKDYQYGVPYSYTDAIQRTTDCYITDEDRSLYADHTAIETVARELQEKDSYEFTYHLRELSGEIRTKQTRFAMHDRSMGIVVFSRADVTDMLAKQEAQKITLSESLAIAQQANNSKSKFLSSMSHDIRTPMNAIVGMCNLAIEDEENRQQVHESLQVIEQSAALLLSMITDILDMNRIESGKIVLTSAVFSFAEQLQLAAGRARALARKKHQTVEVVADIVHDCCRGDVVRIHRAIDNVLANAVKFTPEGGYIRYRLCESGLENKRISLYRFEISDTGIGISPEQQVHIFEPFYRAQNSMTEQAEGTGLGLSIVKSIVDYMGGTISVESIPGEGTTFAIELPLRVEEKVVAEEETVSTRAIDLTGMRVLLCEDHPMNQLVATRILEKAGIMVTVVNNGSDGYETFTRSALGQFDAILMDVQMPVMNGYEATQAIRKSRHLQAKTIPIIAMTANAFAEDVQKSMDCGMNNHLAKPVEPKQLYDTLADCVMESKAKRGTD